MFSRISDQDRRANGLPTIACRRSLRRWNRQLLPKRQTGNKPRSQIVGVDMVNLVTFIIAYPDSMLQEMAVHIYNSGGICTQRKQCPND